MKRVLITGKNSYIGTSVEKWLMREPDKYFVNTIDVKDESWRNHNFSQYDVVFHVAGIVHKKENKSMHDLYFKVNCDLTVDLATKAKSEGVSQFIFMSTMAVYGQEGSLIEEVVLDKEYPTLPKTLYGKSKLKAEQNILLLDDRNFHVLIIRPPMVYGKGCPGNYTKLEKFAKLTPIFPLIHNERSVIEIDNLCKTIQDSILILDNGIILPQDSMYMSTSEQVKKLALLNNKNVYFSKILGLIIMKFGRKNKQIIKIFGNLKYEKEEEY